MQISISSRKIANDCRSLYLEFYENGRRRTENLHLYLKPETDEHAKKENENAMRLAVAARAERILGKQKQEDASRRVCFPSCCLTFWATRWI